MRGTTALLIAAAAGNSFLLHAQLSINTLPGLTYTQNFDGLASAVGSHTWTDNSTLTGWYLTQTAYSVVATSSSAGAAYSFGSAGGPERALGSVASNTTGDIAYGVRFKNTTADPITSVALSYAGEQWRQAANNSAQRIEFAYRIGNGPLDSLTTVGFNSLNLLDFVSPQTGNSIVSLNGNLAANRQSLSLVFALYQPLDPNEELLFRWYDSNDLNSDHGLALDDLSITFVKAVPEAAPLPTLSGAALLVGGVLWLKSRQRSQRAG